MKHTFWWLTLFVGAVNAIAGGSFPLGMDSSRQIVPSTLNAVSFAIAAVDGTGAVYAIGRGDAATLPATTVLGPNSGFVNFAMKISPAGDKIVYLVVLGFDFYAAAVDSTGSVYLVGPNQMAKLNPAGTKLEYTVNIGDDLSIEGLAVDSTGHAYVTGTTSSTSLATTPGAFQTSVSNSTLHSFVIKLNPAGTAFEYATYLNGTGNDFAEGIAVDSTGAAFVRGYATSPDFPITPEAYKSTGPGPYLVRLAPDGSHLVYGTFLGDGGDDVGSVASDPAGNAVVAHLDHNRSVKLLRFDPTGALKAQSQTLSAPLSNSSLVIDAGGTVYFTGSVFFTYYPVKSNLAECGSVVFAAFDLAGNLLQSTYVGDAGNSSPTVTAERRGTALALGLNGNIYVATPAMFVSLSSKTPPRFVPLACVGNAASFEPGTIAPGEIVSLFGEGLGPQQGIQPDMTLQKGFPTTLAAVQVTFDGIPAPLLYVQGTQINAIAPWRLHAGQSTNLCVVYNGVAANCLNRAVAATAPGVFTVDGAHAALNQDGTINSAANPAKAGCPVSVFVNGLGSLTPSPPDGAIVDAPLPMLLEPVSISRQYREPFDPNTYWDPVTVQYAGPAPGLVAGVSQVNFVPTYSAEYRVQGASYKEASQSFSVYIGSNPNGSKCP